MEKKRNKKLFAIIGGSVLAFVLTIALSVSITLAYFGATDNGKTTVSLGQALTVNSTQAEDAKITDVLPGQKLNVTANATVAKSSTTGFLMALVSVTTTATGEGVTASNLTDAVKVDSKWANVGTEKNTNETVYVYGTASKLTATTNTAEDQTVKFIDGITIPDEEITNAYAGSDLVISVRFIVVQSSIPGEGANGFIEGDVSFAQAKDAFASIYSFEMNA